MYSHSYSHVHIYIYIYMHIYIYSYFGNDSGGSFGSFLSLPPVDLSLAPDDWPSLTISDRLATRLDLCVPSLQKGHANLLCIAPSSMDDPRRESSRGPTNMLKPRPLATGWSVA